MLLALFRAQQFFLGGETWYSDDSLKWRTHLSGAFGVFSNAHEIHLSGAPEKAYEAVAKCPENARNC